MKILKYTFNIPQLIVEDDELLEMGTKEETYTFTLLFKGIDLYEKLSNRPLLNDLIKMASVDGTSSLDVEMVKNLAKASYCKIENGSFHQNMVTADEFSKTMAFAQIGLDTEFMVELLQMASDCCEARQKTTDSNRTSKK